MSVLSFRDVIYQRIVQRGVHAVFGEPGEGWGIEQHPGELADFLTACHALNVRSLLEIGTGYRGGLSRFLASELGWQVTTVDSQHYGHAYPGVEYRVSSDRIPVAPPHYDVVLVDGAHDEANVRADLAHYWKAANAVFAFHDICGLRDCEGVAHVWREFAYTKAGKLRKGFHEAIADGDQRGGIGWQVL